MSIPRIFACVAVILVASFETGLTQEPVPEREGRVEIHRFANLSRQPKYNWIGAGIAAVQLVPAAEFILESERRESVSPKDAQYLQSQPRLPTLGQCTPGTSGSSIHR